MLSCCFRVRARDHAIATRVSVVGHVVRPRPQDADPLCGSVVAGNQWCGPRALPHPTNDLDRVCGAPQRRNLGRAETGCSQPLVAFLLEAFGRGKHVHGNGHTACLNALSGRTGHAMHDRARCPDTELLEDDRFRARLPQCRIARRLHTSHALDESGKSWNALRRSIELAEVAIHAEHLPGKRKNRGVVVRVPLDRDRKRGPPLEPA